MCGVCGVVCVWCVCGCVCVVCVCMVCVWCVVSLPSHPDSLRTQSEVLGSPSSLFYTRKLLDVFIFPKEVCPGPTHHLALLLGGTGNSYTQKQKHKQTIHTHNHTPDKNKNNKETAKKGADEEQREFKKVIL